MSAQSTLTVADSWWVRARCEAPGAPSTSQIVQANDGFDFALTSTASPGQKIDCHVCFTPILNASAMGLDLAGDYPDCATVSYTMPDECKCFLPPYPNAGRTESGHPCPGWSEWFDLNFGVVTITGPDKNGASTASGPLYAPNKYCTGCEATKTSYDLCGCAGGTQSETYIGNGGDPTYDPWEPAVDKVCAGTPFQQYRVVAANSCRACNTFLGPQAAVGTMQPDWSNWIGDRSLRCPDEVVTQYRYDKNGCVDWDEQEVSGTKVCDDCECPAGWSSAAPAASVSTGLQCPEGQTLQTASGSGDNPCETCYACAPEGSCCCPSELAYSCPGDCCCCPSGSQPVGIGCACEFTG